QAVNVVYKMPQIFFLSDLRFEGRHTGAGSIANAPEDFAVSRPVPPDARIRKIGGIRDHVHRGFAILAVTPGAITREVAPAPGDRLFGVRNRILELPGVGRAERRVLLVRLNSGGYSSNDQQKHNAR